MGHKYSAFNVMSYLGTAQPKQSYPLQKLEKNNNEHGKEMLVLMVVFVVSCLLWSIKGFHTQQLFSNRLPGFLAQSSATSNTSPLHQLSQVKYQTA